MKFWYLLKDYFPQLKYGKGSAAQRRRKWVFGGKCRETGRVFLALCTNNKRTKKSLWPIILRNVKIGSMLHTDGWRAYRKLPSLGYRHRWVDHSNSVAKCDGNDKNIREKIFTDWGKKIGENMQFCKMKHSLGTFVQLIFNFCVLLLTFFSLFKGFAPSKRTYILQLCTANIMSILMIQACTQMASKANGGKSKGGCLREEDITLHNTSTYTCGLKIKRLRRRIHFGH